MLDLGKLDVDEIAMALLDQTDYEHRWLIDPRTGEIAFWTSDTGIDGRTRSISMNCSRSTQTWFLRGMPSMTLGPIVEQSNGYSKGLVRDDAALRFLVDHPDPDLP